LIFPELSLMGYEPELSKELATKVDDIRLKPLQQLSDNHSIVIGVGLPLNTEGVSQIVWFYFIRIKSV
jgi:predicted amidohydrolase